MRRVTRRSSRLIDDCSLCGCLTFLAGAIKIDGVSRRVPLRAMCYQKEKRRRAFCATFRRGGRARSAPDCSSRGLEFRRIETMMHPRCDRSRSSPIMPERCYAAERALDTRANERSILASSRTAAGITSGTRSRRDHARVIIVVGQCSGSRSSPSFSQR